MAVSMVSQNVFAAGQITREHVQALAKQGYTDIVCNRPDEEHPDGPVSALIEQAATGLGLSFHYLPVDGYNAPVEQARKLKHLAMQRNAKILVYCRSGARSRSLWTLATSRGLDHTVSA